jgi:hypothetical protein
MTLHTKCNVLMEEMLGDLTADVSNEEKTFMAKI